MNEIRDLPLLSVRDLAVSFRSRGRGPVHAVRQLSFTVYPRQTLAIVGESGSGKSVSVLSLLGLLPSPPMQIESGRAMLRDRDSRGEADILALGEAGLRRVRGGEVAMIFQEPMTSLNPVLSIGDQLAEAVELHQGLRGRAAREACVRALESVGIERAASRLRDYPHQFSGGMRQRVMIAMAIACRPRVLIADEPTTALDVTIQAQILDLLDEMRRTEGLGIVLITHDLGVVAGRADVVCVMYAGRVVEYGRTEEVLAQPFHPYTRALLGCVPRIGERREHLLTVADVLAEAGSLSGPIAGTVAWWPGAAPGGVGEARLPVLKEVEPGRWVCLCRSPVSESLPGGLPDVRPPAPPA